LIGQIVNYRYEVLEKIGDGAIFSVYKARDKVLNRLVSLKIFRQETSDNTNFCSAVCDGYKTASVLSHSSISKILDTDCSSSVPFVALEYVRGMSVKDRIKRVGAAPVPLVLDIVIQVLQALQYAHSSGAVHGDLRPEDIIVSPDGEVKITDFGLASGISANPGISDLFPMRSVNYQAPEVIEGAKLSPTADIYSIGVIMYEMLTGAPPFEGPSAVAIALKKSRDIPVPPRNTNPAIPKSLNDLILTALSRDPRERFSNISEMLSDVMLIRDSIRFGKPVNLHTHEEQVSEEQIESSKQDSGLKKLWVLVLIFVLVIVAAFSMTTFFVKGKAQITIPDFRGKGLEEAQVMAKDVGLEVVDNGRGFSEAFPVGTICQQEPAPGEITTSDSKVIKVKISDGSSRIDVPDIKGLSDNDASSKLVASGLLIGNSRQQYSDTVPEGAVISQKPIAGSKVPRDSSVDIVVSKGANPNSVSSDTEDGSNTDSNTAEYSVDVSVPADAGSPQTVKIIVIDDNGENTYFEEDREPGDRFTVTVPTVGKHPRIQVFIADKKIEDVRY
jgi:eukaryotic-like serine/threonine-protein kinase